MKKEMPWLRLYTEIVDDEKLRLLAFQDRWHYIAILCCKRKGILDEPCSADLRNRKIAIKLGIQPDELDQLARRLSEVGLVDRETIQPTGWASRQFVSDGDPTATERQRRRREKIKEKQEDNDSDDDITDASRVTDTDVTALDTDTDTEKGTDVPLSTAKADRPPACPHMEIIDLYHEVLPELRGIVKSRWSGSKDEEALRTRWREDKRHQSLEFWERFFNLVRTSRHWMGDNDRGWKADLRWLVQRRNFDKAVERMADPRDASHG